MTAAPPLQPEDLPDLHYVYVLAGQVQVATTPTRFTTVLGSCVAVCLYDTRLGLGGINHVQMPDHPRKKDKEINRWAAPGTEALLRQLYDLGATRDSLRAKLFGGASISKSRVPEHLRIGSQNIRSVLTVLHEHNIRISNSSTGGHTGIKVLFDSHTGSVWVKKLVPSG